MTNGGQIPTESFGSGLTISPFFKAFVSTAAAADRKSVV
jgi:hypothetical protein